MKKKKFVTTSPLFKTLLSAVAKITLLPEDEAVAFAVEMVYYLLRDRPEQIEWAVTQSLDEEVTRD